MAANSPRVLAVDLIAAQSKSADRERIRYTSRSESISDDAVYIVRIQLEAALPTTSRGLFLFVGQERIERYMQFSGGIYFKIYDPAFLDEHAGEPLYFSEDGETMIDTGWSLPAQQVAADSSGFASDAGLPTQEEVLQGPSVTADAMDAAGLLSPLVTDEVLDSFQIHLLDPGYQKYGDCILCQFGATTLLIDGAHPGNEDRSTHQPAKNYPSIPEQLEQLLGSSKPFHVSLLVITHCHWDHYGCLPALVKRGDLTADMALLADPDLGWGPSNGFDTAAPPVPTGVSRLLAAMREEDLASDEDDASILHFLDSAAQGESSYREMIGTLQSSGTQVVLFDGTNAAPIEQAFQHIGLRVLGPDAEHLRICAEKVQEDDDQGRSDLARFFAFNSITDEVTAYRTFSQAADAQSSGSSAAINDQSILLLLEKLGRRILLTGDMQLVNPEVSGLKEKMAGLRQMVAGRAPYDFFKIGHHAARNAFNSSLLEMLGNTSLFGISTGFQDLKHPNGMVLTDLAAHEQTGHDIRWVRTDRNGLVSITFREQGTPQVQISRGKINDALPKVAGEQPHDTPSDSEDAFQPETGSNVAESEGIVTFSVPLEISVRLSAGGVPAPADFTPASVSQSAPTSSLISRVRVAPTNLNLSNAENNASLMLRRSFLRLSANNALPYYDEVADANARNAYYQDIPQSALTKEERYRRLSTLLRQTHTRQLNYSAARYNHLYVWVDLRENGKLRSIYTGDEYSPREILENDFNLEMARMARLQEWFVSNSASNSVGTFADLEDRMSALDEEGPFNCEHVVPQKWFKPRSLPMKGDLHHLFTCDPACNTRRSNFPFFDSPTFPEVGADRCGKVTSNQFEPAQGKGIVARATLYFLLRYPGEINNNANEYTPAGVQLLLNWHHAEPVTLFERHRNAAVEQAQGNRNPLVDFPDWEDKIDFLQGLG